MLTKKAAPKKKAAKKSPKTSAKKPAKKPVAKAAKSAKPKAKAPAKRSAKKAAAPKVVAVKAVTDSTGVVTMKSVDDQGSSPEVKPATVKAQYDKETGAIIMVPDTDD